ncbi:unnamed protein product [Bemisia tabaci]|uniref:CHHC U11-48K-type domain-containing protein n=1 Tax=Bemisia tabaci TaxID=7038 RepID=A0A9P0EW48_BEMTA|nr:unnamed protein product [Bemisia tabaci]
MKACLYNSAHIVPDVEWEYHMEECEDRIKGDLMRYQVERNPAFENNTVIPLSDIPDVECDEDWNLPQNPVSINAIIQEKIKEEKVLIPLIGAPKAERKKYYMEERRRHNTLEDAKPSTSNTSVPVDKNQPLRKPKTISELSAGPSCAPPFSQQVPPNLKSKETDEQRIDVNALEETSALVKGTVKPSRMFPKGRGRAPCNNVAASSQPEPKVGSSVPSSCRAAEPIPSVCDVSQNMANLSIDPISFGSIGGDGSISNPIPNKGRGRKFLNDLRREHAYFFLQWQSINS